MTTEVKREPYALTTPCAQCPFRSDIEPYLRKGRIIEIRNKIRAGAEFYCHKTTGRAGEDDDGYDDDGTTFIPSGYEIVCAGFLILMEKLGESNQMTRISERLGMYDPTKLDMKAPVYDSWEKLADAQEPKPKRRRRKR